MIVAGLMVAPSAPLGWVEYIRAGDDAMLHVRRKRRGESCACRATCLDIVGLDKKGGRVNDAREETRVVDLGKMGKCVLAACLEGGDEGTRGTMQDYSCMWLVDWRKPQVSKVFVSGLIIP